MSEPEKPVRVYLYGEPSEYQFDDTSLQIKKLCDVEGKLTPIYLMTEQGIIDYLQILEEGSRAYNTVELYLKAHAGHPVHRVVCYRHWPDVLPYVGLHYPHDVSSQ